MDTFGELRNSSMSQGCKVGLKSSKTRGITVLTTDKKRIQADDLVGD